jgi:hypothetical protein
MCIFLFSKYIIDPSLPILEIKDEGNVGKHGENWRPVPYSPMDWHLNGGLSICILKNCEQRF